MIRRTALLAAVVLGAAAGAATCMTVLLLFLGAFGSGTIDRVLLWVFGTAITCALGAITAFATEIQTAVDGVTAGKEPDLLSGQLARDALVLCHKECESVRTGRAVAVA